MAIRPSGRTMPWKVAASSSGRMLIGRRSVPIEWSEADAPPVSVPDDSDVEAVLTH